MTILEMYDQLQPYNEAEWPDVSDATAGKAPKLELRWFDITDVKDRTDLNWGDFKKLLGIGPDDLLFSKYAKDGPYMQAIVGIQGGV